MTMKRYFWGLSFLWILAAMPLAASTSLIYVMNNGGTTISVIDPATNKVVDTIQDIERPEAARFSPDGSRVYITNSVEKVLDVVDRKTGKHLKSVPLTGHANELAITKDGRRVLVCIKDIPGGLDIIDTTALERVKTIPMKEGLHDIVLTEDGKYAFTGGESAGKLFTVFDLQSEQVAWDIEFENGVLPLAIENGPGGSARRIFLQLHYFNGFAVVDFAKRREVARIKLPEEPGGFAPMTGLSLSHGMGIAPDGKTLWVTSKPDNAAFVYSLPELNLLGDVPLPELKLPGKNPVTGSPNWVTFTPDSKTVYVSNAKLNSVSAIDVKSRREVAVIPVGEAPKRMVTLVLP